MELTLAGRRALSVRAHLPAWGAWYADVQLDGEVSLTGRVDLVVNDLLLKGTVLSGGPASGRSDFRVVGGAGGLGKGLPKKAYANDAGVKVSTVVGDAMREAGESFDAATAPSSSRLGPAWTRPADIASRVLEQVAPAGWYVGEDGLVRLGARPTKTFTGKAERVSPIDQARRRLTVAAEASLSALVPGVVVDGLEAIDVIHTADAASGLRTTLHGRGIAVASKLLDSFRRILEQLDPDRLFRGTYEYRVVSQSGKRADLQPVLVSAGMPDLQRVPVRPGVAGADSQLALGSRVLVTWVNADPARPIVVGFEDADGEGFKPTTTTIDVTGTLKLGNGGRAVACHGDTVVCPAGTGTITATQSKVLAP